MSAPNSEACFSQRALDLMMCPVTRAPLTCAADTITTLDGDRRYRVERGIPHFADDVCSDEGRRQQAHYDRVEQQYLENLSYPHTQEYMAFLDRQLLRVIDSRGLGTVAELCCGRGEAFHLLGDRIGFGIGVDVSSRMLAAATKEHDPSRFCFVQADATMLPLRDETCDSVFMLGGVHHVPNRQALFNEIQRVLKPGGRFYFREPVSDFFLWRWLRAVIYRLSPSLDHQTERPLVREEVHPILEAAGMKCVSYRTHGFLGFCIFMNSDILVFNRYFRYIPGIRTITRWVTRFDEFVTSLPGFGSAGLQVIGVAEKGL